MEEKVYPPPKVIGTDEPRKRILIPTGKRYSGAAVERIIKEYKKRSREDNSKANKYKKMYEKTWARYVRVRESVKKTNKKVWFKIGRERGNHRAALKRYDQKLIRMEEKYKRQMVANKKKVQASYKLMMKGEKKKLAEYKKGLYKILRKKFKFYDPNENTNVNTIKVIVWARIFAKLSYVRKQTKLNVKEIVVLLFMSQHENGATTRMFKDDMNLGDISLTTYARRLIKLNIMSYEKKQGQNAYRFFLTEKGWTFVNSILNFVKKEKTVVKKIKPKYIRSNVPVPGSSASSGDAE
jgi:hypothetical protein